MWRLGFFFHETALGLLSVFIPLYVVAATGLSGSLVQLGIMTSAALFAGIPASYFWGYICDRTRRFKVYILLSFFSLSMILFAFAFIRNITLFVVLYVVMQMFHVAHESPKNVLVAEHYSREEWQKSYAHYEVLTETDWLLGLLLGLLASVFSLSSQNILLLCSGLNVAAFVASLFLVADPILIFERRLVGIEKKVDFTYRGVGAASQILDGYSPTISVSQESFLAFGVALVFFTLASSIFFTPLPVFFREQLDFPVAMVFVVYMLNSAGSIVGYLVAGRRSATSDARTQISGIVFLRSALIFLLVIVIQLAVATTLLSELILVLLGFAYAVYYVLTLSLSMELIPPGKNATFDVLVGIGAASGSFIGPFLANALGYLPEFVVAGTLFFIAFLILIIFTK
jgi:MFS family permease